MKNKKITHKNSPQQGAVLFSVLVLFLVLSVFAVTSATLMATAQETFLFSSQSTQSFYSADSGIEMALKEYLEGQDLDNDGSVGGISDDGNNANNPVLGTASLYVDFTDSAFTSTATAGQTKRIIEVTIQ